MGAVQYDRKRFLRVDAYFDWVPLAVLDPLRVIGWKAGGQHRRALGVGAERGVDDRFATLEGREDV